MVLPVQKSHLRESGIGKLVVAMAADPAETRDNRELIKQARKRDEEGERKREWGCDEKSTAVEGKMGRGGGDASQLSRELGKAGFHTL